MKGEPQGRWPDTVDEEALSPMRKLLTLALLAPLFALAGTACWRTTGDPVVIADGDADADADAGPPRVLPLDLLFLVDNSNSMWEEQELLTQSFPDLLGRLVNPEDADHDGAPDQPPVEDLHVGVISTDMGTGGFHVPTCEDAIDGDDGILQNEPFEGATGCDESYPQYLSWSPGDDPAALATDFACIGTLGTGGCGFEQQLEAIRKAVTVHAEGANEFFLREGSVLAIVLVTDEEDCSIRQDIGNATDIFNPDLALGPLNLRCYNHRAQYVEPVDTFVHRLLDVRREHPERLVVAPIVGTPLGADCGSRDMQCLLDLPEMQEVIDNSEEGQGERLTPSCEVPGLGEAFPPRRIVQFAGRILESGGGINVQSICRQDWTLSMQSIARTISARLAD